MCSKAERSIRKMFTREEMKDLKLRVRTELLPGLENARRNWEENLPSDEDPESYIQPFSDLLSALEREFPSDDDVTATVEREKVFVQRWIENTLQDLAERADQHEEPDYDPSDYSHSDRNVAVAERSILMTSISNLDGFYEFVLLLALKSFNPIPKIVPCADARGRSQL